MLCTPHLLNPTLTAQHTTPHHTTPQRTTMQLKAHNAGPTPRRTGYLSEAAASVVCKRLGFGIVPETAVVKLQSKAFNYSYLRRELYRKMVAQLPHKLGSFQLFVHGYRDADAALADMRASPAWPMHKGAFQLEFEKMVILDYIIRNTDRGTQNWLIRCNWASMIWIPPSNPKSIKLRPPPSPAQRSTMLNVIYSWRLHVCC